MAIRARIEALGSFSRRFGGRGVVLVDAEKDCVAGTAEAAAVGDDGETYLAKASVITLKPAIRYQFKTGQRDWPET